MKRKTIILSYSEEDAIWASDYFKKNPQETVIILTPTISAQLVLKKNNIPYFNWYEIEEYEQSISFDHKESPYSRVTEILTQIEKKVSLNFILINDINIFSVLKDSLRTLFNDILHCYNLYQKLIKKWGPQKIYLPKIDKKLYKTGEGNFFSLAYYTKWYFKNPKIKKIFYSQNPRPIKSITKIFKYYIIKVFLLKYLIIKIYLLIKQARLKSFDFNHNKSYLLMETGGVITSYYYKFFKIIRKKYNLLLITYKLQIPQQINLIKNGIRYQSLDSLWEKADNKRLYAELKSVKRALFQIKNLNIDQMVPWVNRDLNFAFKDQAILFIRLNVRNIIKKLIINNNLINKYSPSLVINSHDPSPTGLSLVLPAKKQNIESILFLHGLPVGQYHTFFFSDYLITWGNKLQVFFENYSNMEKNNIFTSGFTLIDSYSNIVNRKIKRLKKFRSISEIKLGLLLTNYHPNDSYLSRFLLELVSIFKNSGININYRLHEGFSLPGIENLGKHLSCLMNNKSSQPLDKFINENDIILSLDTTAILWTMIYHKPLFYTSPLWGKGFLPLDLYKAAWIPNNSQDLFDKLIEFKNNPNIYKELLPGQKKFLGDYAGPLDGKSSERLSNIIEKLVKAKN